MGKFCSNSARYSVLQREYSSGHKKISLKRLSVRWIRLNIGRRVKQWRVSIYRMKSERISYLVATWNDFFRAEKLMYFNAEFWLKKIFYFYDYLWSRCVEESVSGVVELHHLRYVSLMGLKGSLERRVISRESKNGVGLEQVKEKG